MDPFLFNTVNEYISKEVALYCVWSSLGIVAYKAYSKGLTAVAASLSGVACMWEIYDGRSRLSHHDYMNRPARYSGSILAGL